MELEHLIMDSFLCTLHVQVPRSFPWIKEMCIKKQYKDRPCCQKQASYCSQVELDPFLQASASPLSVYDSATRHCWMPFDVRKDHPFLSLPQLQPPPRLLLLLLLVKTTLLPLLLLLLSSSSFFLLLLLLLLLLLSLPLAPISTYLYYHYH